MSRFCENCDREFTPPELKNVPLLKPPSQRFCRACWCYECDQDAGVCVGYCGVDGHTDEHLTDDLVCTLCEEEWEAAPDLMAEQINLCGQMLRDGGAR